MAMTVHQMRIFWAVSQAKSYTKASKILGLAQPSLSQQIAKLEDELGAKLFNRIAGKIQLTDAGQFLYAKAEIILANFEETEEGLKEFSKKTRGILKVGMLSSVARNLLPPTLKLLKTFPNIQINVLEVAPAEAIDLLYARQLNIAVVAADSIAAANLSFVSNEVYSDPYVLAVPKSIDLSDIKNIKNLDEEKQNILKSTILFEFGSQHKKRIDSWFEKNLGDINVFANTRSYEVALSMVEAGLGVVVLPALTAVIGSGQVYNVNLYETEIMQRRLVSLTPNQFSKVEPSKSFIKCLVEAGNVLNLPKINKIPPILKNANNGNN